MYIDTYMYTCVYIITYMYIHIYVYMYGNMVTGLRDMSDLKEQFLNGEEEDAEEEDVTDDTVRDRVKSRKFSKCRIE